LKEWLKQRGEEQIQDKLLRQSSLFRSLRLSEQSADLAREETYTDGQVLFWQGDPSDKVYFVLSGMADVYEEDGDERNLILQIGPGRTVGERGLVEQKPRSATIIANGTLKVFTIDGKYFLSMQEQSPELREYMQTLKKAYPLAGHGFASQYIGTFMDQPCITTVASMADGRTSFSSLVIGQDIFNMSLVLDEDAESELETVHYQNTTLNLERELVLSGNFVVGVTAQGHWHELGKVYRMVLDQTPLSVEQLANFRKEGILQTEIALPLYQDHEIVCDCLQVSRRDLRLAIESGCQYVDDLAEATGASTVCGACKVLLQEMVGEADWTPVRVDSVIPVAQDIKAFRFVPHSKDLQPVRPGQHILIQAHIDGRWIQRPYTISSAAQEMAYREITVKREEQGLFSGWLFKERWQDALIRISDPQGEYAIDLQEEKPIVCMVGGIGMTPALAFCRSIVRVGNGRQIYVDYSVSTEEQLAYADELQKMAAAQPNVHLNIRVTRKDGRITPDDVKSLIQKHPRADYYICGPEAYNHAIQDSLKAQAIPETRIFTEEFTAIGDKPQPIARDYFYLGLVLIALFAVQDIFQLKIPALEMWQAGESFRRWTGLILTLYMAAQFILPIMRWRGNVRTAAKYYNLHKLQGAFAPLVYYIHATSLGYAYLLVLSVVFFANFVLGLFNQEIVAKPEQKKQYTYYWLIGHVVLSLLTIALLIFHIYIVFAYQ
jgi:ferredoxin-NADP reductase